MHCVYFETIYDFTIEIKNGSLLSFKVRKCISLGITVSKNNNNAMIYRVEN